MANDDVSEPNDKAATLGTPRHFNGLWTDYGMDGADLIILCFLDEHRDLFRGWLDQHHIDPGVGLKHWMLEKRSRLDAYATLQAAGLRVREAD
ncbi:MAG: hypothetical protein ACYDHY_15255 [Acidiferrobacterales bacterium]